MDQCGKYSLPKGFYTIGNSVVARKSIREPFIMIKQRTTFILLCRATGEEYHIYDAAAGDRLSAGYTVLVSLFSSFQHNSHGTEGKKLKMFPC